MRSFLALALALAAGCADPVSPESAAVPEGSAEPDWRAQLAAVRGGTSDEIRVGDRSVSRAQFGELGRGCGRLRTLVIDRAELADVDLAVLRSLPRLRWLKLPGAVGDGGAEAIADLRELEILNLPESRLSDTGLRRLATLDRLTLLRFGSPNVTDGGLASLRDLPHLRFLHLMGVPITDAGLGTVAAIPTLESFYLDGGNATDAGLSRLLAERPDLHFHKDQRHLPRDPNAHPH